jgi:hypothetical protein
MKPITCKICKHQFFKEKEEKPKWTEDKLPCPSCGETYCTLPETERRLHRLQDDYLARGRDPDVLGEMYLIMVPYTTSLIRQRFSHVVSPMDHEKKAIKAVTFLIEDFCKKDSYVIRISFGGTLYFKIRQALYGTPEYDEDSKARKYDYSLVSMDKENPDGIDGRSIQVADHNIASSVDAYESLQGNTEIQDFLLNLIWGYENQIPDEETEYRRLMALTVYLEQGESVFDKFLTRYGRKGKWEMEQTLRLIRHGLEKM